MWAATLGFIGPLIALLKHNADIESNSKNGYTPLVIAAHSGHPNVVHILLKHGADVFARTEGFSALDWAEYEGVDGMATTIEYNKVDCSCTTKDHGATIRDMLQEEESRRRKQTPAWDHT